MPEEVIDQARRASFDRKAEEYDAVRPGYPAALVAELLARRAPQRILEVGAGTGKATMLFASAVRELVALEPGANLAAVLRRKIAGLPHVTVEQVTFEAYLGGGFDLVYAAQAFHWIEPAVRYAKAAEVLRPGGALAVITNETAAIDRGLRSELDAAYARWAPENVRASDDGPGMAALQWTTEIAASERFGPVDVGRFPWSAIYTSRRYIDLLDTYSDHAVLPADRRIPLYAELTKAIDRRGGEIHIPYVALVFSATVR